MRIELYWRRVIGQVSTSNVLIAIIWSSRHALIELLPVTSQHESTLHYNSTVTHQNTTLHPQTR